MSWKRVLRYVGNREAPEKELYDPLERLITLSGMRDAANMVMVSPRRMGKTFMLAALAHLPNPMFSDFHVASPDSELFTPIHPSGPDLFSTYWHLSSMGRWPTGPLAGEEIAEGPPEEEFEVNMMEALVGWRAWRLWNGTLQSINSGHQWKADKATEAKCSRKCKAPAEHCSCGIYAVTDRNSIPSRGDVFGEVYGWGRYVRGEDGWRAQYAYPKSFMLEYDDAELIEPLKKYHVPIYIEQPTLIYNPEEDGYEYRQNEAHGDCGASQESAANEEGSSDDSDEDND